MGIYAPIIGTLASTYFKKLCLCSRNVFTKNASDIVIFLELKDSLSRMGSDLKQGFISSLKSAWQTLNEFARAHTSSTQLQAELEKVANQIKEEEEKQVVEGRLTFH